LPPAETPPDALPSLLANGASYADVLPVENTRHLAGMYVVLPRTPRAASWLLRLPRCRQTTATAATSDQCALNLATHNTYHSIAAALWFTRIARFHHQHQSHFLARCASSRTAHACISAAPPCRDNGNHRAAGARTGWRNAHAASH